MVNHSSLNISSARVLTSAWVVALVLFASVSFADPVLYTDDTLPAANISIGADGVEFQLSAAKTYAYTMSGSGAFYKTGDGTLTLNKNGSTFTGDVHLDGGKISVSAKCTGTNSTLGKVQAGRTIYISNGTELIFANQDILTNAHNDNPVAYVVDGGKISNSGAYYNFLQTVTLKNGANIHAANGNTTWEAYKFQNINVVSNSDGSAATAPTITGANNDHAVISFGAKSDDVATKPSTIYVENITNNANSDLVISAKIVNATTVNTGVKTAGEIYKTGTGTLELKNINSSYSGNLTIKEGTLKVTAGSNADNRTASALGASNVAGRTVTVNKGAVLELAAQDVMCDTHSDTKLLFVLDGGKITNSGANFNFLQNVTLKDGANIYAANGNTSWEAYKIQNLRVERSGDAAAAAVSLTAASGDHNVFTFGAISNNITTTPVSIYVEDITSANGASDAATDLLISAKIVDANIDGKTKKPAPMVKSGAGTLELKNAGNTYSGNLTINEGTVKVTAGSASNNRTASALGASNVAGRLITVNEGAVLDLTVDNVIVNAHTSSKLAIVVDGGQIINSGYNFLQNLTLKDGAQVYAANGAEVWKAYKFHNLNVVRKSADAADAPVVISSDLSKPHATIAFGDISNTIKVGDNNSISTVTVEEITSADPSVNDNVSDLVISAIIADPLHTTSGALTNATQIVKAGAGTMEITAANTITGKTTISEGAIKLSGAGTLGSGEVINNSNLEFAHESDQTFSNALSGNGSVTKTGSGTLTLSGAKTYSGETTVSGGTLLIPSGSSLGTYKVTVASDSVATFQTGANLDGIAFELGEGGTFVIGETSASKDITIGALTLDGGTIRFDFNDPTVLDDGYNIDTDWLHVSTAALNSGVIDLTFNNNSEDAWWNVIKNNYGDEGFEIITGQISDYQSFNPDNVQVAVNGALSSDWTLTATESGLFLLTKADEPVEPWFFPNSSDAEATSWTIDGTTKLGVQFTEGDSMTSSYGGNIIMSGNGEFNVGTGRTLTLGGVISDEGDVTKTGDGILKLTGANTYTGKTTISEGMLEINNNFTSSSGLAGSGTLKLSGDKKYFDIGDASEFTGTVQVFDDGISADSRVNLAGANGTTSTNIDLSNATVVINGNKTSGKFSEIAFLKGNSTLSIGTLNGNENGRILNTDGTTTTATFNNLIVGNGNYAGEIGRSTNNTSYPYVNHINLTKADDGSADGGTLTLSAKYLSYMGTTTIEGGTLEITNNLSDSNYQYFARSTGLKGSGTLSFTGSNWTVFSLDGTNGSALQDFNGTINAAAKVMITNEARSAARTLNLGNATLNVKSNGLIGLHGVKNSAVSNLTVKELNVEEGGVIRICSNDPGSNYGTLTAARGMISGTLGQENTVWNKVNLVKVSDGTASGGTLTIEGQNYFTGETTVSGGTLKLTGNAVAANGPITVGDGATLEFNVTSDKKLELSAANAISSTGQIVKTGAGTLRFDADENSFDAKDLVLAEGRLDFKGSMSGNITVTNGVFSPGNSVGTASVTGNVVITGDGKALFEFSAYNDGEGVFDVLNIINSDDTDFAFTAGASMVQLFFENDDASLWAAALDVNETGYKLVSGADFTSADISSWLGTDTDRFTLAGRSDGLYLIGLGADPGPGPGPGPDPGSGVPEPSTWALLALGVIVLFLRKRVRS